MALPESYIFEFLTNCLELFEIYVTFYLIETCINLFCTYEPEAESLAESR